MKLLWKMLCCFFRRKISISELGYDKTYLLVIARDADINIGYLREQFKILELQVVVVFSNYVDGIKFL